MTRLRTIADLPAATAQADPDRPALVLGERTVSFGDLERAAERATTALASVGARGGDVTAIVVPTGLAAVSALLGGARLGVAGALVNPALGRRERTVLVEAAGGARAIVATTGPDDTTDWTAGPGLVDAALLDGPLPAPDGPPRPPGPRPEDVDPTTSAIVLFTSGTTGTPKAVPISHQAILERVRSYSQGSDVKVTPGARLMCAPIFHIGGLIGLLLNLWSGRPTVVQARFDAGEWLALVERHRVESCFLVPTMLHRILEHPDFTSRDLSSLDTLSYGAAAAPRQLIERAMEALPHVGLVNTFGQTETLGGYTALSPAEHRDRRRIGSVGRALGGVEIAIVAPGTEDRRAVDEVGEVLVRADQNVGEGWLRTGDLGRLDAEGYLYPMGRLSDTINRGGEKFGPAEIEEVLRAHPAVAEAGVAGVPDPEMGERVGAVVVARGPVDAATLRAHCRAELAPFKVPEVVVFADRLPYTDMGKLTRASLRALLVPSAGGPTG